MNRSSGGGGGAEEMMPLVYAELRSLAASYIRKERSGHTLQPTALVHQAFLKLASSPDLEPVDEVRFLGIAARAMRQVLVDHARGRASRKRGGDRAKSRLSVSDVAASSPDVDVLELNDAVERLATLDERQARVVEMRFFGGLTMEETARALGISKRLAELDWTLARAFLRRELGRGNP